MDFLQSLLETLAVAVRRLWPGVLGAAALGYLGWSTAGFLGFAVGCALGALAGTWAGARLGLVPVPKATGSTSVDHLLHATGAFLVVGALYLLAQFALVVAAVVAVIAIAIFWLSAG